MKRGLLALAVMGALGSSVSLGGTHLCRTPAAMSYPASEPLASESSACAVERAYVLAPAVVTESRPAIAPRWIVESADAPRVVPEVSSVTITREYDREW